MSWIVLAALTVTNPEDAVVRLDSGCSGVVVSSDGLLLTSEHCGNDRKVKVTFSDGSQGSAELIYAPVKNGIDEAQLYKLQGEGPFKFAAVSKVPVNPGDAVWSVGYPAGNYQLNRGAVKKIGYTVSNGRQSVTLKQGIVTDWDTDGGNSGGPLLNVSGEVVGLLSMSAEGEPASFWIGLNSIKDALQPKAYRRSEIVVFTTAGCAPCDRLRADVKAGRFTGYNFRFVSYDQTLRAWSDPDIPIEFVKATGAPAGLGFPVIWVRGTDRYRVGYDANRPGGLLGWIVTVLDSVAKVIVGEQPEPVMPPIKGSGVPDPVPDDPPAPIDQTKAAIDKLRADVGRATANIERLKSANPLTKLKGVVALKSDLKTIKADAAAALSSAKATKEDMKERPLSYLWGLLGVISGLLHRRFAH